jgi:hypothetical protein
MWKQPEYLVPKISTLHSPIANLEHPFALSDSNDAIVRILLTQAIGAPGYC